MRALAYQEIGCGLRPRHPIVCILDLLCLALALWFLATQSLRAVGILAVVIFLQNVASILHHWLPHGRTRHVVDHLLIVVLISAIHVQFVVGLPPPSGSVLPLSIIAVCATLVFVARLAFHTRGVLCGILYFLLGATSFFVSLGSLQQLPAMGFAGFLLGAALYTGQLVLFVLKKPDFLPNLFGYREVQHSILLITNGLYLTMAAAYLSPPPA